MNTMAQQNRPKRIMIVDDHRLVLEGLAQLIERDKELSVAALVENAEDALEIVARDVPDLLIVDISLKGLSGLDLTSRLRESHPSLPVLILSMHKESVYAERALKMGARGYIMKEMAVSDLLMAVRHVLDGKIYLSPQMKEFLVERAVKPSDLNSEARGAGILSARELEVLQLLGQGIKTRQIAKMLDLSPKTVDSHCANIKSKLRLKDVAELNEYAVLWVNGQTK